jgi:hypothetical protein
VIQHRLHLDDLTGNLLEKGGYDLLTLPEEFEPERACVTSIGWKDPRTQPGELLWPKKNGPDEISQDQTGSGQLSLRGAVSAAPLARAALRANIDETVLLVVIIEQGENRNQCEEQRNLFGFPHGFARCGT